MSNRAISTELIELGERIRKRRQEMKLSQESFAEKAGISVNTVSRIEGGQTAMSVEIFRKMIEILETDANILMGKEGDDAEKRKQFEEVFYRIQKMEWKEQKIMNEKMIRAAIGKTGDSALKLVAVEYLNYMIEHPGVYEIIQWASWNGTEETAIIFNDYLSLLKTLICSCGFNPDKTTEILSMVTGMLHGYTTLQLRYAFSNPDKVRKELSEAIDTLLLGANQKYKD